MVVVDVECISGLQVDAIQRVELSVGNQHIGRSRHFGGKSKVLQCGQSGPSDTVNSLQSREAEGLEDGELVQLEALADLRQAIGRQRSQIDCTVASQAPGDALDPIELDGVGSLRGNDDIAGEGCAIGQS